MAYCNSPLPELKGKRRRKRGAYRIWGSASLVTLKPKAGWSHGEAGCCGRGWRDVGTSRVRTLPKPQAHPSHTRAGWSQGRARASAQAHLSRYAARDKKVLRESALNSPGNWRYEVRAAFRARASFPTPFVDWSVGISAKRQVRPLIAKICYLVIATCKH